MDSLKTLTKSYFAMVNIQSLNHQLENAGLEVSDLLYDTLGSLMGQSSTSEGEYCYKTYTLDDGELISIKESQQLVSQGTTGLRTWQAAQFLAEWAMENSEILKDKCVLELGSGLGLTGLVIHTTCQPRNLILSDHHPSVLNLLTHNIDSNLNLKRDTGNLTDFKDIGSSGDVDSYMWRPSEEHWIKLTGLSENATTWENKHFPNMHVATLDWECLTPSEISHQLGDVDVIVAADVVYDLSIIPTLVRILEQLLKQEKSPKAYIASTVRNEATREQFLKGLDEQKIEYTVLPGPIREVFLYDKSTFIELLRLQICST